MQQAIDVSVSSPRTARRSQSYQGASKKPHFLGASKIGGESGMKQVDEGCEGLEEGVDHQAIHRCHLHIGDSTNCTPEPNLRRQTIPSVCMCLFALDKQ